MLQVLAFAGPIAYIFAAAVAGSIIYERSRICHYCGRDKNGFETFWMAVVWPLTLILFLGWYTPLACRYLYKKLTEPRPPRPLPDLKPRQPWENA